MSHYISCGTPNSSGLLENIDLMMYVRYII